MHEERHLYLPLAHTVLQCPQDEINANILLAPSCRTPDVYLMCTLQISRAIQSLAGQDMKDWHIHIPSPIPCSFNCHSAQALRHQIMTVHHVPFQGFQVPASNISTHLHFWWVERGSFAPAEWWYHQTAVVELFWTGPSNPPPLRGGSVACILSLSSFCFSSP